MTAAELDALEALATNTETWEAIPDGGTAYMFVGFTKIGRRVVVAKDLRMEDAELIAALRNAAPALIEAARKVAAVESGWTPNGPPSFATRYLLAERDALKAKLAAADKLIQASGCPNCGATYRRERNGAPCDYEWHSLREAAYDAAARKGE